MSRIREWLDYRSRKLLGAILCRKGEDGHMLLCRFISAVAHYGPHGTYCLVDRNRLDSGGTLCTFGCSCGDPTQDYMQRMNEELEQFHRIQRALEKSGGMMSFIMENPRFSSSALCNCGQPSNPRLPEHVPLCPYRIEHDFPISVEEYKEVMGLVN